MEKITAKNPDLGACPKCGSTDRQSGRLNASEMFPLQFDTDTVRSVSDSGPVRGIVCNQCKHLELFVS
ncbi:MAG: hypothetical protein JWM99_2016 [Verrucomicrobiales bacterium]|nr:hypothetical protein [Verrucomicrobiales bacterium]